MAVKKPLKKSQGLSDIDLAKESNKIGEDSAANNVELKETLVAINVSIPESYHERFKILSIKKRFKMGIKAREAVCNMIDLEST